MAIQQASDFTAVFPEFSNATTYPVATINYWIGQSAFQLNQCNFGNSLDLATCLFVAYNVVLSARAAQVTAAGGVVGDPTGPLSSKTVGSASASYDVGLTAIEGAGPYNANSYGQRLFLLMKACNAGPRYVPRQRRGFGYGGIPGYSRYPGC